jgi:arylsulfatase A
MNGRFKLYRDGRFFEYASDLGEERPLATASLRGEAAGAYRTLRSALERYRDARPPDLAAQAGRPEPAVRKQNRRNQAEGGGGVR